MHAYRTHNCSEIREKNVGEKIRLAGWVQVVRDLGGVVFIDLRDQYGITQVVVSGNDELVDKATRIPNESTITVYGTVRKRDEETVNTNIDTGTVELFAEEIEILEKYGAINAANLDGGTSTCMTVKNTLINDATALNGEHRSRPVATAFVLTKDASDDGDYSVVANKLD